MRVLVLAGGDSAEREVSLESGRCVSEALRDRGHDVDLLDPARHPLPDLDATEWDVALPVVHGTGGEDGTLQTVLKRISLPYVGSSPEASELTFDKVRTNEFLASHRIRVPDSVVTLLEQSSAEQLALIDSLRAFEPGCHGVVTKPAQQGSSIGVSIVHSRHDLRIALQRAFSTTTAVWWNGLSLVERSRSR